MNIILYILDGLRPDFLGCYGFDKNTSPEIDALAKDSVLYDNAYSVSNWTKAAAVSIITSQHPRSLRMMHEEDAVTSGENTLPKALKRHNFRSYAASANLFFSPNFGFSDFDKFFNLQIDKELIEKRKILKAKNLEMMPSEDINEKIFPIFEKDKQANKFIMIWSSDTHSPFFVRGKKSFFGNLAEDFIRGRDIGSHNLEKVKSLYCDMIRYNDQQLGRLILKLKEKNIYQDSLIIVAADHGEAFGEHRWILGRPAFGHSGIVYEEVVKIPLIIKYPQNEFADRRSGEPVQLIDICPTILDIIGGHHREFEMEGVSLNPSRAPIGKERIIFTESQIIPVSSYSAGIKIGDKKLIKVEIPFYFGRKWKRLIRNVLEKIQISSIQFYDLSFDPHEQKNLAGKNKKEVRCFLEKYYEILEKCDKKSKSAGRGGKEAIGEEVKKRLRNLGYFNE